MDDSELHAHLAAIVESTDDAILTKDLNGIVRSCNPAAERMFGYTAAEIVGQPVLILIPSDRYDEETQILATLRRGQRVDHYETVRVTKDGRLIDVSLTVSPMRGASGQILGASKIARDITGRKRDEERHRALSAERERLLLSERSARNEAERANRVKDDFVAMVSHELRTPLNAILGWTELLLELMRKSESDPKTLTHGLEVIGRNTRLQAQLIADLLDVSRIVSGKLRLELEPVDLTLVIRSSIEALQSTAAEKGLTIVARLDNQTPVIKGDPARLQQMILNVLSNAVKFTPSGGTITVSLCSAFNNVQIVVADTGIGIRPDLLPDLFERFRQGSGSTTRRHGGLGLGLSIAKHLTELHGGTIQASSPGEHLGATFTIELPLSAVASAELSRGLDSTEAYRNVSLRDIKVLVVEDDPDTRDLIRRLLEAHRATVSVAASAPEALDLFVTSCPDLLLSDIGLPDVDGYELVRRLRAMDGDVSRIPAIALTAFARSDDRTRALRAGFNAHVAKPVEPADLLITVGSFSHLIASNRVR